jgi:metacaspase-1
MRGGQEYLRGNKQAAFAIAQQGLQSILSGNKNQTQAAPQPDGLKEDGKKHTRATVIQFSGCKDDQTSADANIAGNASGALSWAFMEVFCSYFGTSLHVN